MKRSAHSTPVPARPAPARGRRPRKRLQRQASAADEEAQARRGRELLAWYEADADWSFISSGGINFVYEA